MGEVLLAGRASDGGPNSQDSAERPIGPPSLARPANNNGPILLWRDASERNGKFAAGDAVHNEFADGASEFSDDLNRRNFLKVAGASLAVAAIAGAGCDYVPETKIVPYVNPPAQDIPGQPTFYATAMPMSGFGYGVLAESHEGRPTKIEGNPDHPASLGKTNVFMQASVLQLYDPQRAREVTFGGQSSTWDLFFAALRDRLDARQAVGGKGIALLMGRTTSPTMLSLLAELQRRFPAIALHRHEAVDRTVSVTTPLLIYNFEKAKVILSLDSDFLFEEPGSIHYAMKFADGRRVRHDKAEMNRLYVVEGNYSMTGSMADHRQAVRPSQIAAIAAAFAQELGVPTGDAHLPPPADSLKAWIATVAKDLRSAGPAALVVPGMFQPPAVQTLAMAMNKALGSWQNCVTYRDVEAGPGPHDVQPLAPLVASMRSGAIDSLLILGGNPAHDAPVDLHFADELERFSRAPAGTAGEGYRNLSARLGLYDDETSYRCQWNLPESHYLESWGDIRGYDGSGSIIQPLILPLYLSRSAIELIDAMLGRSRGGYQIVREYWLSTYPQPAQYESDWQQHLQKGVLSFAPAVVDFNYGYATGPAAPKTESADQVELIFRPDPTVYDGSFATLGWLQECPKPFTKLTWDNAALISPAMAKRKGLVDGDMVRLSLRGESLECGVLVLPGHADGCVTLHLGYGRERAGDIGNGRGFNAYRLRFSDSPWFAAGATLTPLSGQKYTFAITRSHHAMDAVGDTFAKDAGTGLLRPEDVETPKTSDYDIEVHNRKLVRVMDLSQYSDHPAETIRRLGGEAEEHQPLLSLYPGWDYSKGMQWAMSIDLNSCIGCNACVVACVAENNIATVGKEQVIKQREMHWIRIDDYFAGDENDPRVFHEPVPCQHCENAPCEVVCPVGATTHSEDGLNEMTYNRCVGTRYCSNNCPYKVRRFNFLLYSDETTPSLQGQRNPEVTVRSRGVMEKCTYCVQRIQRTKIEIEKMQVQLESQGRFDDVPAIQKQMLASLQTACQQACPTNAIVFGDKNDPASDVAKLKREPLDYSLLTELTTVPRTTYLARLTNRNPALTEGSA
jgi:Fe-S-cluster-containing dehydrogenase component